MNRYSDNYDEKPIKLKSFKDFNMKNRYQIDDKEKLVKKPNFLKRMAAKVSKALSSDELRIIATLLMAYLVWTGKHKDNPDITDTLEDIASERVNFRTLESIRSALSNIINMLSSNKKSSSKTKRHSTTRRRRR